MSNKTLPQDMVRLVSYALLDTKSHASKISKVTMSKLLGGVISKLVLIVLVTPAFLNSTFQNKLEFPFAN
jgi:hypothetical protein